MLVSVLTEQAAIEAAKPEVTANKGVRQPMILDAASMIGVISGLVAALAGIAALVRPLIKIWAAYSSKLPTKIDISFPQNDEESRTFHLELPKYRLNESQIQELVNFLKEAENEEKNPSEWPELGKKPGMFL